MTRRDARLTVRVTPEERARMVSRARAAGLTASELVRRRCLSGPSGPRIVVDASELRAVHAELRRVGSNLNQIARALNAGGLPGDAAVAFALAEVARASSAAASLLEAAREGA